MTMQAYTGAKILANGQWHDQHALVVQQGLVWGIVAAGDVPAQSEHIALSQGFLIPGFFDTQVNGGGGVLFNDTPTLEGIAAIAAAHRAFGTTAMLPTLISDDLTVVEKAIQAVDAAIAENTPGVVGIHIEGPFLNPDKKGIHDAGKFRTLDSAAIDVLSSLKNGKTLVTLAPECAPEGAIAELVKRGVVVAAGHSLANYDNMACAAKQGLSGVTHLFNAMTQLGSREPGMVGAAIDLGLYAGIIADGHHVHPASLRAAYHAKGPGQLMLVTDAMPCAGTDMTGFAMGNVWISREGGSLRGPDGTLAGSDLDMAHAVRNACALLGVDLATASQMASATPTKFMGLQNSMGSLAAGQRADFVHLDDAMSVKKTWIGGKAG
jgi:N-acetylglucosamine-6-phosphate deacetylase